jgi:hypothetical protein
MKYLVLCGLMFASFCFGVYVVPENNTQEETPILMFKPTDKGGIHIECLDKKCGVIEMNNFNCFTWKPNFSLSGCPLEETK